VVSCYGNQCTGCVVSLSVMTSGQLLWESVHWLCGLMVNNDQWSAVMGISALAVWSHCQ